MQQENKIMKQTTWILGMQHDSRFLWKITLLRRLTSAFQYRNLEINSLNMYMSWTCNTCQRDQCEACTSTVNNLY